MQQNNMNLYGKLPPQALELESAVLGAMMIAPDRVEDVFTIIKSEQYFYSYANQRIFTSIKRLSEAGTGIDFISVTNDMRAHGQLELVGGAYYVTGLTKDMVTGAHIEDHARVIVEKYIAREIIRTSGELLSRAYEDTTDVFELLQEAESQLSKISEENITMPYLQIGYGITKDIEGIANQMERVKNNDQSLTGVNTGFQTINKITLGWQPGDLIILAARPSVGKTAFALNLIMNAINSGVACGLFSLEMTIEAIRLRMVSMINTIGLTNIRAGRIDNLQFDKITGNIHKFKSMPMFVDDSHSLKLFDLKAKARRMKKKHDIGIIIIDYLQLISPDNEKVIREQQISKTSRALKGLAKELKIPIIALSQLNRNIDNAGKTREPVLADLRESGAIEQDADLVSFLYRTEDGPVINWKLAKHRNGKVDKVTLYANLDIQIFSEHNTADINVQGFAATEFSGRLTPVSEANEKFKEDDAPF